MPAYAITVEDVLTREHIITEKRAHPLRVEPFYHYTQQGITLPVVQVDLALPIYRMANWRTRTKQLDHIHREELDHGYFQNGEEDIGPQRIQHEILVAFAERGRGETIIPIIQKLRQDKRQTEALLVTSTGVVVNGNRRLAAMRELFAEDPGSFPFQSVQVAVLPAALTLQELKKIEFQLQMQQETKLPYDWTIQCLSVKELAESGISHQEIMHMMRLGRAEEVQAMITRLNEAEMYLSDYLGTPEDYSGIERQEQQFIELQRALDRKSDPGEKELARRLCYVITKHSRDLDTRAYDFKIAFGKETKQVAERLAERMEIALPDEAPPPPTDDEDVFGDDTGGATARFEPVRQLLAESTRSEELAVAITDICTEIREENQGEQDAKKPLKQVKRARLLLAGVEIEKAAPDTLDGIRAELGEIVELSQALLNEVEDTAEGASEGSA